MIGGNPDYSGIDLIETEAVPRAAVRSQCPYAQADDAHALRRRQARLQNQAGAGTRCALRAVDVA